MFRVWPAGQFPPTPDKIAQLATQRIALHVMLDGDKIIGFANLYNCQPNVLAFIGNVVLDSAYRGQGLGTQLIRHMIRTGFEDYQLTQINISVFSDNSIALLLYHKLGFTPYDVEERLDHHQQRRALIHLQLKRDATP